MYSPGRANARDQAQQDAWEKEEAFGCTVNPQLCPNRACTLSHPACTNWAILRVHTPAIASCVSGSEKSSSIARAGCTGR
eukprot:scaffold4365_cov21-Tisochrysis_lutea.AAC.1